MQQELIWALFQVLNLYVEARIRIRIWIKVKGRIRFRIRIKVTSRIRIQIRIKVMGIRKPCSRRYSARFYIYSSMQGTQQNPVGSWQQGIFQTRILLKTTTRSWQGAHTPDDKRKTDCQRERVGRGISDASTVLDSWLLQCFLPWWVIRWKGNM